MVAVVRSSREDTESILNNDPKVRKNVVRVLGLRKEKKNLGHIRKKSGMHGWLSRIDF